MLSVIIQNKKTIESFNEYYPLFFEAIESSSVAVCRWFETGTSIDTALPDLNDITDGVEEWRAIIVQTEDEISGLEANPNNPFDYLENAEMDDTIKESSIPLIRLTQILGGIPAPTVKFDTVKVQSDKGNAEKTVYVPIKDEEQERLHKQLCEKYAFDGKRPKEIVLIKTRNRVVDEEEDAKDAWNTFEEVESSEFWKRNKYPSICRFIVFDISKNGQNQREAEMFNFWLSTQLLAINELNPNVLQAYRLYRVKTDINRRKMQDTFQKRVMELAGARHFLEEEIKRDIEKKITEKKELPVYHIDVPVSVDMPKFGEFKIDDKNFKIISSTQNNDYNTWNTLQSDVLNKLDKTVVNSERAINETADRMRHRIAMADDGYVELSQYQKEDLNNELDNIYEEIIETQCVLSNISNKYRKQLEKPNQNVRNRIRYRVTFGSAITTLCIVLAIVLIFVAIAFYPYAESNCGDIKGILGLIGIFSVVALVVELAVLLIDKLKFNEQITRFNVSLSSCITDICINAEKFSRFITNIASYSRGKSYLENLNKRKHIIENSHYQQEEHIKEINKFLNKLQKWSDAHYLKTNFDYDCYSAIAVEYEKPAKKYSKYTIDYKSRYNVLLNNSGEQIESYFDFVDKFNLQREELYNE